MTDLLDTPVGEFDWGPRRRHHRARDAMNGASLRRLGPLMMIVCGMGLLVTGVALAAFS